MVQLVNMSRMKEGVSLSKNSLASVVLEIQFENRLYINDTISKFQQKVHKQYPKLNPLFNVKVPDSGDTLFLWRFQSEDNSESIFIGFDRIVYEQSKYIDFRTFKENSLNVILSFLELNEIDQIGFTLRYINNIPLGQNVDNIQQLKAWFNLDYIPKILNEKCLEYQSTMVHEEKDFVIRCISVFKRAVDGKEPTGSIYIIDLIASVANKVNKDDLSKQLSVSHNLVKSEFFARITDEFRALTKEEV